MTRIEVSYLLTDDQVTRVERIARVLGNESVEDCFRFLMQIGSQHTIDSRLDQAERMEPMRSVLRQAPAEGDANRCTSDH